MRAEVHSSERRREPRRPSCWDPTVVRVVMRPNFHSFRAPVRDVSAHGLAFVHQGPLEPGTVLALQLRAGVAGTSCIRTARVAHCTPCEEGGNRLHR
jgi:hypothetical protein